MTVATSRIERHYGTYESEQRPHADRYGDSSLSGNHERDQEEERGAALYLQ
jgi:hypothetical protein